MFAIALDSKTKLENNPRHYDGYCTCCGAYATFTAAGIQKIPAKVAAATGLPESVQLWTCSECKSTIAETELLF